MFDYNAFFNNVLHFGTDPYLAVQALANSMYPPGDIAHQFVVQQANLFLWTHRMEFPWQIRHPTTAEQSLEGGL